VSNLVSTLILSGIISGTDPICIMALLLLLGGAKSTRAAWAFIGGEFAVQTTIVFFATFVLGGTVKPNSAPGRSFIYIRIAIGVALIVVGLRWRRPPKKPSPAVPKSLQKLHNEGASKVFVAGLVLADYQGPVIASLAITASSLTLGGGRLLAAALYTLFATGIPVAFLLVCTHWDRADKLLDEGMDWLMKHRRQVGSWASLVIGVLVIINALTS
jgi:hypothetical protein